MVETNVRWHLALGASAVFVYLDDPRDPAAANLAAIPSCTVHLCDAAYWRSRRPNKGRPPSQMRRQTINANHAQNGCDLDWLFHLDADEFIWQDGDFRQELAAHDDPSVELNLPVLERIFPDGPQHTLFDGAFRVTSDLSDDDAKSAFGSFAPFMKRGQYSHGAGKSGVRVGAGLRLGGHNATRTGSEGRQRRAPKQVSTAARLLHFDGVTPLHWIMKSLRYQNTPPEVQASILQTHRASQLHWMAERFADLAQARDAHHDMFALTLDRADRLKAHDLLSHIPFSPLRVLGSECPDLTPATFDADLLRRAPWLADRFDASGR
ncbi:MAG: glycosyltransferase family 2 protein [Tateyamaria sp.]